MTYTTTYPALVPGHLYSCGSSLLMILATKTDEGDDWILFWASDSFIRRTFGGRIGLINVDSLDSLMNYFSPEAPLEDITLEV